ncbi:MAG TPA: hypothetical protein VFK06_20945 [Candidatus Angelobacter sp.]|nr:hypothetical protein [Candidatus Angelobacter sp.]
MALRKFQINDRVKGKEEAPASFRERTGIIVDFKGKGEYGVRFDDATEVTEYVNSNWIAYDES